MTTSPETAPVPAAVDEEDNYVKVFVGNLPFAVKEDEIAQHFSACGKVEKVIIISRFGRSLGFGFVSFNTLPEAEKATLLDKVDFNGRPLNIEVARKKVARVPKTPEELAALKEKRKPAAPAAVKKNEESRIDDDAPQDSAPRGERPTRGRGGAKAARGGRPKREPRGDPQENEQSPTMLFISNLPYKVTDDDLKSIFKDYQVTSAHVVRLKSGLSKGFGFVDVANNVEQSKILNDLQNVQVDGRELIIKVAFKDQQPRVEVPEPTN